MVSVVVTPTAQADLERLVRTHSLPVDTRERFRRSIGMLGEFPELGGRLEGRWSHFRFLLGPWRWMIVVYHYDAAADHVAIVTIQDGRSSTAPTGSS